MRNLILLLALAGTIFGIGCGGSNQDAGSASPVEQQEEAWAKMMEVHDAVMPKMAEMNRASRELKALAEGLEDKTQLELINNAVENLEAASEGMMAWMGELKQPKKLREEKSHEEIMDYLNAETEEITQVQEDMLSSLEQGQVLLKELQAETSAE
jgi:uncharacterized protein YukE